MYILPALATQPTTIQPFALGRPPAEAFRAIAAAISAQAEPVPAEVLASVEAGEKAIREGMLHVVEFTTVFDYLATLRPVVEFTAMSDNLGLVGGSFSAGKAQWKPGKTCQPCPILSACRAVAEAAAPFGKRVMFYMAAAGERNADVFPRPTQAPPPRL